VNDQIQNTDETGVAQRWEIVWLTIGNDMKSLESLTPRQREILQMIAEGQSTKQMALSLNISVKTVETHRAQLMDRLQIHNLAGLVRYAIRNDLIRLED
jgi:DNA-binding NarL/FixJ family response regulator